MSAPAEAEQQPSTAVTPYSSTGGSGHPGRTPPDSHPGGSGRPGGGGRPGTSEDEARDRGPATEVREDEDAVGNCTRYANERYFGEDCVTSVTNTSQSYREILGEQPFPRCRVTPLPTGMTPPLPPLGQEGRWMLHVCNDNVTIDGITPGQSLRRRAELVFYPLGTPVPALSPEQQLVFDSLSSSYPTPIVVFGPVHPPRVGVTTAFWLAAPPGTASRGTITTAAGESLSTLVTTATGENGTLFRAYVTQTLVFPGVSSDEAPVACPGAGTPQPDTARPATGAPCTVTYTRSSAHLPDARYNVTVEAVWTVEYQNPDGTWTALDAQVPVTTLFRTPVHEIQTVTTSR